MKKQNKILEEIYTVRTITAFSVFCVLFTVLLFMLKVDDLLLYIASKYILAVSAALSLAGAFMWIFGKAKKEPLRAFTLAFTGQLVFFGSLSAVLFAILIRDTMPSDAFGVLLAYGIICVALYTVWASARESFSHALCVGLGVSALYVLKYFQGGGKFIPLLISALAVFGAYAVFALFCKKIPKCEKYAIVAATLFNAGAAILFAFEPPLFYYLIGGEAVLYFVTRLFVKL